MNLFKACKVPGKNLFPEDVKVIVFFRVSCGCSVDSSEEEGRNVGKCPELLGGGPLWLRY